MRRLVVAPVVPAAVIAASIALTGCGGGAGTAATSSGAASSTSSPTGVPSQSSTSAGPSSSSTSTSSTSSTSTAKPTPTVNLQLVKSCLTSTAKVAAATIRWNAALKTQKSSFIDSAAKNYRTTAGDIRKTTAAAADKTYTKYIGAVAKDMETMASQSASGQATVSGDALTRDSKTLTSYCQRKTVG